MHHTHRGNKRGRRYGLFPSGGSVRRSGITGRSVGGVKRIERGRERSGCGARTGAQRIAPGLAQHAAAGTAGGGLLPRRAAAGRGRELRDPATGRRRPPPAHRQRAVIAGAVSRRVRWHAGRFRHEPVRHGDLRAAHGLRPRLRACARVGRVPPHRARQRPARGLDHTARRRQRRRVGRARRVPEPALGGPRRPRRRCCATSPAASRPCSTSRPLPSASR